MPYDKLSDVRGRLAEISPTFDRPGRVEETGFDNVSDDVTIVSFFYFHYFKLLLSVATLNSQRFYPTHHV